MTKLTPGSGEVAGPCCTAPVKASNAEPWQGHWRVRPPAATRQPSCVQIALCPTTRPLEGRPTTTSPTLSEPPTGTFARLVSAPAAKSAVGFATVDGEAGAGVVALPPA